MNRNEVRARAARYVMTTKPHPYLVTVFYVAVAELTAILSVRVGGQPFLIDLDALAAGDPNAIRFVPQNLSVWTSVLLLGVELLYIMLDFGYASYCLHACRREKCSFFDLMDGFFVFFRALGLRIIQGFLVSIGTMLFIVPGFIVRYIYSQTDRLLLDHPDWSVRRCMRESRRLMRGHLKEYFFLRLSLLIWNLACMFPLLAVFAQPWSQFSETVYYLGLIGTDFSENTEIREKPPWVY